MFASDFHNKIENNSEKRSQLYYLIDLFDHIDLLTDNDLKLLGILDITIKKNLSLILHHPIYFK